MATAGPLRWMELLPFGGVEHNRRSHDLACAVHLSWREFRPSAMESALPSHNSLSERELLRRAMVNTMRLFSAEQLGSDASLFRETVMQTLDIVRRRQGELGLEIGDSMILLSRFFQSLCLARGLGCSGRVAYSAVVEVQSGHGSIAAVCVRNRCANLKSNPTTRKRVEQCHCKLHRARFFGCVTLPVFISQIRRVLSLRATTSCPSASLQRRVSPSRRAKKTRRQRLNCPISRKWRDRSR